MTQTSIKKERNGRFLVTVTHPETDSYSVSCPTRERAEYVAMLCRHGLYNP